MFTNIRLLAKKLNYWCLPILKKVVAIGDKNLCELFNQENNRVVEKLNPLLIAAENGHTEVVTLLLQSGSKYC